MNPQTNGTSGNLNRREFLQNSLAWTAVGAVSANSILQAAEGQLPARKMKICLSPGMIGVRANTTESIRMAAQYGFEAIEPNMTELAAMTESAMAQFLEQLKAKNLVFGAAGMGMPITRPQDQFSSWLASVPKLAGVLQRAGGKRVTTWINCGDSKLTYLQNLKLHAKRVGEIAQVLGDHGLVFGLEYIGPKTSWSRSRFPFIHTMQEMKELIAETGKRNVGFLLDSWHWHTAGESAADLLSLRNEDVVAVHVNDAPAGLAVDQQIDSKRALPAATGVINIGGFLGALQQIGYDGPVAAEPFDDELRKQAPDVILQRSMDAIRKGFAQIKI